MKPIHCVRNPKKGLAMDNPSIEHLNFLVSTYDACTKTLTATKNRICHLNPELKPEHDDIIKAMEAIKDKVSRKITKHLNMWPIWTHWMENIPGCGPAIASNLILLYYYKFVPICKDCAGELIRDDGLKCSECGKPAKSDGVLQYRIDRKRFEKVSSWWHYMGMHCDDTGRKPKLKSGVVSDWNSKGRAICYQLGEQFIKQSKGPYRAFYDDRKRKREQTHPDATQFHRNNMARHETAKLFLAHFMAVAKHLDGEEFTKPYAHTLMGHTNYIEPFMFDAA